MTTSSLDVADEEQFFLTQADNHSETEEKTLQRKKQPLQNATEWVANKETSTSTTSVKDFFRQTDGKATSYSMNGIMANA